MQAQPLIDISLANLLLAFLPAILVVGIYLRWSLDARGVFIALLRMLVQLLAIGYVLVFLFDADRGVLVLLTLVVMILAAAWIALVPVKSYRRTLFSNSLIAVAVSGTLVLVVIVVGVLQAEPWYAPRLWIPLAGMLYANAMNSVSLSAERFISEWQRQEGYKQARDRAFGAAMIPVLNSMLAVGVVSLPGMMTGQILSGVSPLVATRYQIVIMVAIFSASGLASALFLYRLKNASCFTRET